jgi:hypothetical protein
MPTPLLHWHHFRHCAGIFAIVATNTAVVYCRCQTNLCHASLFWLIVVFMAHCRGGAADDKKWCVAAEDDGAYHQSAAAKDDAVYPRGGEEMITSGVAQRKMMVPAIKVP